MHGCTVSRVIDRRSHIQGESDRFGIVLATADPASRVPTCPDWNVVDLLKHLTHVHQFWAAVIGQRLTATEIGAAYAAQRLSPVELTRALLERIAARDREINSFIMVDADAQILVVKKYLSLLSATTRVILCSGNHDLDERSAEGERQYRIGSGEYGDGRPKNASLQTREQTGDLPALGRDEIAIGTRWPINEAFQA